MPAPSVVWPELIIGKEHSRLVVNRFDCAVRRPFKVSLGGEMDMLSAVAFSASAFLWLTRWTSSARADETRRLSHAHERAPGGCQPWLSTEGAAYRKAW